MSNRPKKKRLRAIADQLWSVAIRDDWLNRCAVCGSGKCEAHHMIPRANYATRFDLRTGIALCATHHKFNTKLSAHGNSESFRLWLEENHHERAAWVSENCRAQFDGTTNELFFCETIWRLKEYVPDETFKRIVGVKFGAWLESDMEGTI
jgi:hypothetical protein